MGEIKQAPRAISGPLISPSELERHVDGELDALLPGSVPEPGAVVGAKYRIERLIARGGMGAVYAATHLVSTKRVALKWMLPAIGKVVGARERFIREACATARIDHPNIVDVYDVGNDGGSVYLVMEFLQGETLAERLIREDIPPQEAIMLLMPALRGVAAAHAHGVIHRDLKPDNIFLCRTHGDELLVPKVLDFGISKIASEDESTDHSMTRSGAVLGTPYYMSPEQVRGAHEVDERTDVYAFGVMLYEILTGQRPFDAETYNQLIVKIATETPLPISELNPTIDPRLISIVETAMARESIQRYPSIEALGLALEPFAGGVRFRSSRALDQSAISLELLAAEPLPPHRPIDSLLQPPYPQLSAADSLHPPGAHRHARATLASALIALVLCAGVFFWMQTHKPSEPRRAVRGSVATDHQLTRNGNAGRHELPTQPAALRPGPVAREVETTTNAISLPPEDEPAAPLEGAKKNVPTPARKGTPPASTSRERRLSDEPPVPTSTSKRTTSGDWDERLPSSPQRASASSTSPAGRIDLHDFR